MSNANNQSEANGFIVGWTSGPSYRVPSIDRAGSSSTAVRSEFGRNVVTTCVVIGAVLILTSSIGQAQIVSTPSKDSDRPKAKIDSDKQQLLDELLDGIEIKGKSSVKTLPKGSGPEASESKLDPAKEAGGEDIGDKDRILPRSDIVKRMQAVQRMLMQRDVSATTQVAQQEIINELEAILEDAKKNSSKTSRSSSPGVKGSKTDPSSQTAAQESTSQSNSRPQGQVTGQLDPATLKSLAKSVWGHLPARVREQMQTPTTEEFLPKYERVIADYYRRLAEEGSSR